MAPTRPGLAGGLAFALTCLAYLATTTGEALLSPLYPAVGPDLGLGLADAGLFFATLAASIAGATVVGGAMVQRVRAPRVVSSALVLTTAGCAVAAAAPARSSFLVSQALIGAGAGLAWPAAVRLVGLLVDPRRRGLSMGVFGVAFSGGLVAAAALAAMGGAVDWRWAFAVAAPPAAAAAVAMLFVTVEPEPAGTSFLAGLGPALGLPSVVGVVAGFSQYATVSFLPVFAVERWVLSTSAAALVLLVARLLSIPVKVAAGALADRVGAESTVALLGLVLAASGAAWALGPTRLGVAGAVVFAAVVSGLFPLANLLALDRSGGGGMALGVFRAVQIGAGAVVGLVLGAAAERYGLRPTIAVVAVVPVVLVGLVVGRPATAR